MAKCVVSKPTTCEDTECDEGMVCEMRKRVKDGAEVPRCRPENPTATRAEDCSQLDCREGLVCEVLGSGQAKCMMIPPPTDCEELDCGAGMECVIVGNKGRVKCVQVFRLVPVVVTDSEEGPTSSGSLTTPRRPLIERGCSDLDCEAGFRCRMLANRAKNGDRRLRPTCVPMQCSMRRPLRPPRGCEEVECGRYAECVVCREGGETRARCQQRPDTDEVNPTRRPDEGEDKPMGINSEKPTADEDKETPMGRTDKNGEKPTGTDKEKPEEDGEKTDEKETPADGTDSRPPVMCEEVECGEDEMCFEFEHEERRLARCVSAG